MLSSEIVGSTTLVWVLMSVGLGNSSLRILKDGNREKEIRWAKIHAVFATVTIFLIMVWLLHAFEILPQ